MRISQINTLALIEAPASFQEIILSLGWETAALFLEIKGAERNDYRENGKRFQGAGGELGIISR